MAVSSRKIYLAGHRRTTEIDPFFCGALSMCAPGGARFLRVEVPNPPGSGKDIAEGKGVEGDLESEGSRM